MTRRTKKPLQTIGWRESVALPDLGVASIKAKVDTGARTSALHAFECVEFERDGAAWVRFEIHPVQRSTKQVTVAEAPILEYRSIRSSSGTVDHRPVIETTVRLMEVEWEVELTLARRDEMGFRMLLGRQALRRRFLVDPGRSFVGSPRVRTSR